MRKLVAILFLSAILSNYLYSQRSIQFGIQSGIVSNSYFYSSTLTNSKSTVNFEGTVGVTVAFLHNAFLLETGVYGIYSQPPYFIYNTLSNSYSIKPNTNGSTLDMAYTPIRIGYNINTSRKRLTISPKLGIGLYHMLNGTGNTHIWADGVDDINLILSGNIPEDPGVTVGYGYNPFNNIFAIDASISLNYTLHKFLQVKLNLFTVSAFKPLYYENINHFGQTQTVYATSTQTGTNFSATIGFSFTIPFVNEHDAEE